MYFPAVVCDYKPLHALMSILAVQNAFSCFLLSLILSQGWQTDWLYWGNIIGCSNLKNKAIRVLCLSAQYFFPQYPKYNSNGSN